MNRKTRRKNASNDSRFGLNWLLELIFRKAFPIWKRNEGNVPAEELQRFDERWDLPPGVAEAAMNRISRDKRLRKQLSDLHDN
jgi:hypothetical protein